jgi:hypothetical protein
MVKGPWPAPSVAAAEKLLGEYLPEHCDLGHRRIHALMTSDGHVTSPSTVLRAIHLRDRGPEPANHRSRSADRFG